MVTWQDLQSFMNGGEQEPLERALAVADALVTPLLAQAYRPVPEAVADEIILEVAQAVFKRNTTPSGQFATTEGVVNVPRDPLAFAMPLIRRYVGWQ